MCTLDIKDVYFRLSFYDGKGHITGVYFGFSFCDDKGRIKVDSIVETKGPLDEMDDYRESDASRAFHFAEE